MTENVKIVSSDGTEFEVERRIAEKSKLIKDLTEEAGDDDIALPNVGSKTLEKIIEFCKHEDTNEYVFLEQPLQNTDLSQLVDKWYADFIDVEKTELFDIVMAANYLNIPALLDLASAKIASNIKDKPIDDVREYLHLKNDFTEEEYKKVLAENQFAAEYF